MTSKTTRSIRSDGNRTRDNQGNILAALSATNRTEQLCPKTKELFSSVYPWCLAPQAERGRARGRWNIHPCVVARCIIPVTRRPTSLHTLEEGSLVAYREPSLGGALFIVARHSGCSNTFWFPTFPEAVTYHTIPHQTITYQTIAHQTIT